MAYTLVSKSFAPLKDVHNGSGTATGHAHTAKPESVEGDAQMDFEWLPYSTEILSLETDSPDPPNWFGVSFRTGITSFDTIHLFCHPHPGHAGMADGDYPARRGEWPKLFRYAEIFGRQMSIAKTNHITVVPFFTSSTYGDLGVVADNWLDLVEQIINQVRNTPQGAAGAGAGAPAGAEAARTPRAATTPVERLVTTDATRKKGAPPPRPTSSALKNVVLSDFSRGRELASRMRASAKGLTTFLREVWDFDGVGGAIPSAPRVLTYDQHGGAGVAKDHFHVPPKRWVKYHNAVIANVHGDIPAMLARHAATISGVGH
jgi:hypothetical protein